MQIQPIAAHRRNAWGRRSIFLGLIFICGFSWLYSREKHSELEVNEDRILESLSLLTSSSHPLGSSRQKFISKWLTKRVDSSWDTKILPFKARVPNSAAFDTRSPVSLFLEKDGYNVIALKPGPKKCWIFIGSHFDTKIVPGMQYVGANDGASTTALLLEMSHHFQPVSCGLALIWFDGEEPVLERWNDGENKHPYGQKDNTYGSRHFVENHTIPCRGSRCFEGSPIKALVLMDMLGSPSLKITKDIHSTPGLVAKVKRYANKLDIPMGFSAPIEDDHIPFLNAGIPAVNIIDFQNVDYWHRQGDVAAHLSIESLKKSFALVNNLIIDLQIKK